MTKTSMQMQRKFYFDNNATTAIAPEVEDAIKATMRIGASNPSSAHTAGMSARDILQQSREQLAKLLNTDPNTIFFTSSGTEANNWVLDSVRYHKSRKLITSSIEHESVVSKAEMLQSEDIDVIKVPVNRDGIVDLDEFTKHLSSDVSLVSIQWVNNETGVIQPIEEIASLCSSAKVRFHTDAAQAVGKLRVNLSHSSIDYLSLTGHKYHAPMGIGALYIASPTSLPALLGGGSQEKGLRPDSENILGICGLGEASRIAAAKLHEKIEYLSKIRDGFETMLLDACSDLKINGYNAARVCNTSNITFPGIDGDALLAQLDAAGIYCSKGSACTASLPEPSHVLTEMGLSHEDANASLRFSFSIYNTIDEVSEATQLILKIYRRLSETISMIRR